METMGKDNGFGRLGTLGNIPEFCFPDGKTVEEKIHHQPTKMKSFLNRMKICVCSVKGFAAFQPPPSPTPEKGKRNLYPGTSWQKF